jgi:hypothetical protein
VVLVSHDPGAIERVCDRVVVLDAGQVIFDGPTADGLLHYHRLMGTEHGGGESLRQGGERAVEVADVELRDAAGRTTAVFRSGGAFQVVVEVRARRPGSLALELRAQEGTRVYRSVHPVPAGSAQLAFDVPELPLLGGDYDLALGGADGPLERTVRFSVASEQPADGIVDLRGTWTSLARVPTP